MFTRPSLLTSTLASTLLGLSLLACSDGGSTSDQALGDDAQADPKGESELRADSFVGRWSTTTVQAGEFRSITLKPGGGYEASIAICPSAPAGGVGCLAVPRDESGHFSILQSGGTQTLRLVPAGASVRRYQISFAATVAVVGAPRAIELTRSGKSQVLNEEVPVGEACGASRCAPGLVCCNPLSAICTKPGEACAF